MKKLVLPVFIAVIGIVMAFSEKEKDPNPKLNVLFIAVDDLRPTLGCYGDSLAKTANMDMLASKGTIFNMAYCQQAVCNASRASIMTGLRPDQINVTNLVNHFREKIPDVVTLPQVFIKNGYEAVAIGKIYHGSAKAQDPMSWTQPSILNVSKKGDEYVLPKNKTGKKAFSYESADVGDEAYEDGQIANAAIKRLSEFKNTGKPFFLAVGFKKPHLPFSAPKKYWDLYDPKMFGPISNKERPLNAPDIAFHNSQELRGYMDIPKKDKIDREKEVSLWHGYYACVSYVDAQLGKIVQSLKKLGLDKNTVIVLWGDHGYHLGEQGLWCKSTNFELDDRIPLIIYDPSKKFKEGTSSNSMVEAVDIYPTLLDLCGLRPEGKLSGQSLKPLLSDPSIELKKAAVSQFIRPYEGLFAKPVTHMGYSVRTRDWRCTAWFNSKNDSIDFLELYNMRDNGIEKINLAGIRDYKNTEAHLLRLLKAYKNQEYEQVADIRF